VVRDPEIAGRLTRDFEQDAGESKKVTLQEWKKRPLSERLMEMVGWVFEREQ
jgi:cardiolipin synthase A/B